MYLESFTSHLQHSRPCYIRYTTLAFARYNTAAHVVNSTSLLLPPSFRESWTNCTYIAVLYSLVLQGYRKHNCQPKKGKHKGIKSNKVTFDCETS